MLDLLPGFRGILSDTRLAISYQVEVMDQEPLWRQYAALPSDAQRQVADFIAFLATRYHAAQPSTPPRESDLTNEPIIGMWADRDDMTDSSAWVRTLRDREWNRRRG